MCKFKHTQTRRVVKGITSGFFAADGSKDLNPSHVLNVSRQRKRNFLFDIIFTSRRLSREFIIYLYLVYFFRLQSFGINSPVPANSRL